MQTKSNVLIVDNNSEELMQLIAFMETDYELSELSGTEDYIDQATSLCPDIILVDDMIVEPNCYDICHAFKSDPVTGSIPIILMSDLSASELDEEVGYLGSDDYICKPFAKEMLIEKIETLLSFSRAH